MSVLAYSARSILSNVLIVVLVLGTTGNLTGCVFEEEPAVERAQRARNGDGKIIVGAAWPWEARDEILYWQGMKLALEEVNEKGVQGRKLEIVRRDDKETVRQARLVAGRFAENLDMVAVIGHLQSFTTRPAARIYDEAGLLHLVPSATANDLTGDTRPLLFRTTFSNRSLGKKLAGFVRSQGYRRVAIRYLSGQYGRELANAFEQRATQGNVVITSRDSYDATLEENPESIERVVAGMEDSDLDAVFLAGEVPLASMIISRMRTVGVEAPVIGGDAMNVPGLYQVGGDAVEGTIVPSRFNADESREEAQRFRQAFREAYGVEPDAGAVSGYDAVHLLAKAMRTAGSTVPDKVAEALRQMKQVPGVAGSYTFDENGNLVNRKIRLQVVQDGEFVPFDSERFALRFESQ